MRTTLPALVLLLAAAGARAEGPLVKYGDPVPRDVREIYDAGLRHLLKTQDASGAWKSQQHGTPAPTGTGLMVLLAGGEDPNFGLYQGPIRRALRALVNEQDGASGYIGGEGGRPSTAAYLERASRGSPAAANPMMGGRGAGSGYEHYYRAQALFQCNVQAWEQWNNGFVKTLKATQAKDGSFSNSYGPEVDTPLTLLALAVNYKFLPVYER